MYDSIRVGHQVWMVSSRGHDQQASSAGNVDSRRCNDQLTKSASALATGLSSLPRGRAAIKQSINQFLHPQSCSHLHYVHLLHENEIQCTCTRAFEALVCGSMYCARQFLERTWIKTATSRWANSNRAPRPPPDLLYLQQLTFNGASVLQAWSS